MKTIQYRFQNRLVAFLGGASLVLGLFSVSSDVHAVLPRKNGVEQGAIHQNNDRLVGNQGKESFPYFSVIEAKIPLRGKSLSKSQQKAWDLLSQVMSNSQRSI